GASHFLEHLIFKGTVTRAARDIAESIDAVGGEMNAFTSREHTAFYTRLPADDVDAEREVILEELALSQDTPDDKVHSLLADAVFPEHPLGREVLGDEDTVAAMSPPSSAITTGRPASSSPPPDDSSTTRSSSRCAASSTASIRVRDRCAPRRLRTPSPRSCSTAPPSRRTSRSGGGPSTRPTRTGSRSPSPTRCSAGDSRAGCSRRSARNAASPTACTPARR